MFSSATNLLHDAKLRVTPGRKAVLQSLLLTDKPLSFKEVLEAIQPLSLDPATIYRILHVLESCELIQTVKLDPEFTYWEIKNHHHHLKCEQCGKVVNLTECLLKPGESKLMRLSSFQNIRHSLEFFGICNACTTQNKLKSS